MPLLRRALLTLLMLIAPLAHADDRVDIGAVLDRFHGAAAKAQFEPYFALFTADGVFIGTDASERWTVSQFKAYAKPHFDKGRGWTYTQAERHISLAPDGSHAFFDELLDNANLGRCRGTGVLRKEAGQWKIAQYHLTIPVPNALADSVVKQIRSAQP